MVPPRLVERTQKFCSYLSWINDAGGAVFGAATFSGGVLYRLLGQAALRTWPQPINNTGSAIRQGCRPGEADHTLTANATRRAFPSPGLNSLKRSPVSSRPDLSRLWRPWPTAWLTPLDAGHVPQLRPATFRNCGFQRVLWQAAPGNWVHRKRE